MSDQPIASVIISVFNGSQYIRGAIESVLNQTFKDFEIIVVDDGSTDDTKVILEPWVAEGKIRYVYQQNKGLAGARNTGIKTAKGEFLKFLDCDDLLYPRQLELQVDHLKDKGNIISITDHVLEFENGKQKKVVIDVSRGSQLARLIRANFTPVHSILVRKDRIVAEGCFDEELKALEDAYLWLRLVFHGASFERLDYCGCCYRIVQGSLSADQKRMFLMKCRLYEKINDLLSEKITTLEAEEKDSLLMVNMKMILGCFARGMAPEKHVPKSMDNASCLYLENKKGFRRKVFQCLGTENYLRLKYFLNLIKNRDYANELIQSDTWWRDGDQ